MKADGWRLVDDSEEEIPADLAQRIYPLSTMVRGMIILFCERADHICAQTRIKFNKEGNRLLHWLPKIIELLRGKVDADAVEVMREPFTNAYDYFFLKVEQERETNPLTGAAAQTPRPAAGRPGGDRIPGLSFPNRQGTPPPRYPTPAAGAATPNMATPPVAPPGPRPGGGPAVPLTPPRTPSFGFSPPPGAAPGPDATKLRRETASRRRSRGCTAPWSAPTAAAAYAIRKTCWRSWRNFSPPARPASWSACPTDPASQSTPKRASA